MFNPYVQYGLNKAAEEAGNEALYPPKDCLQMMCIPCKPV
jgi:hypothetical protein